MKHAPFLTRLGAKLFTRSRLLATWWSRRAGIAGGGDIPWAPLAGRPGEWTVALVTTGGVHLAGDRPFDMGDRRGDPSFREIPSDAPSDRLVVTHDYYDHRDVDRDVNVMFPVDRLREMAADGEVGGLAPTFYSFMGHVTDARLAELERGTAPDVARGIAAGGAGLVLLTPA